MLGRRRANWKMRIAQCKRLADSAIDAAGIGTFDEYPEYLELAADFLELAKDIELQHAGEVHFPAPDEAVADYPMPLAA